MADARVEDKKVEIGIIGGGKGGLEILSTFLRSSKVSIKYVCDRQQDAPAMKAAQKLKIANILDLNEALNQKVDYVLEVTGSEKVSKIVHEKCQEHNYRMFDYSMLRFVFDAFSEIYDVDDEDLHTEVDRYVTFSLCKEPYSIPIDCVTEITNMKQITKIPDMPSYVLGVIQLRDQVIPIVSLRHLFEQPPSDINEQTCIVIVRLSGQLIGFVVDKMEGIDHIPESEIATSNMMKSWQARKFVSSVGKASDRMCLILDLNRLLTHEEVTEISDKASKGDTSQIPNS